MKTKQQKIVEVLKELSQLHVKTDEPEEVWVLSSTDDDDTFKEAATAIEQLEPEGEIDWAAIDHDFWLKYKGEHISHHSIITWFKDRFKKLTPQQPSEGEIKEICLKPGACLTLCSTYKRTGIHCANENIEE